jgi:hypothetical protein
MYTRLHYTSFFEEFNKKNKYINNNNNNNNIFQLSHASQPDMSLGRNGMPLLRKLSQGHGKN